MTLYSAWDVVVVPYPYIDSASVKKRPGLIVSSNYLAEQCGVYWIMMITSASNSSWIGDIKIKDIEIAGLNKECVIRPAKINTITADAILYKIGCLSHKERPKIRKILAEFVVE